MAGPDTSLHRTARSQMCASNTSYPAPSRANIAHSIVVAFSIACYAAPAAETERRSYVRSSYVRTFGRNDNGGKLELSAPPLIWYLRTFERPNVRTSERRSRLCRGRFRRIQQRTLPQAVMR